ncbi:hypothetical protein ACFQ60_22595 [Streptomyces zhihengii]
MRPTEAAAFGTFARQYMKDRQKRGRTNSRRWDYLESYLLPAGSRRTCGRSRGTTWTPGS